MDALLGGTTIAFSYSKDTLGYATYSTRVSNSYGFHFEGTVTTAGSPSAIEIRIIDGYGDTSTSPLTLSGKAYITLVGAIN